MEKKHEPVMASEVVEITKNLKVHLKNKKPKVIDATLGFAGHTLKFLENGFQVLGIEADEEVYDYAVKKVTEACPASENFSREDYTFLNANFINLQKLATSNGFENVDAILFDLGINSYQLTSLKRGFSFQESNAPLDMRISKVDQKVTARDLLNLLREDQLASLFESVMDKGASKRLAKSVVKVRETHKFENVGDLLRVTGKKENWQKIHPATKAFMALRIAVNSELENVKLALPQAYELLKEGGVLIVLTFHSGEDKIIKDYFAELVAYGKAKYQNERFISPSELEVNTNNRARSAKLRSIVKVN